MKKSLVDKNSETIFINLIQSVYNSFKYSKHN